LATDELLSSQVFKKPKHIGSKEIGALELMAVQKRGTSTPGNHYRGYTGQVVGTDVERTPTSVFKAGKGGARYSSKNSAQVDIGMSSVIRPRASIGKVSFNFGRKSTESAYSVDIDTGEFFNSPSIGHYDTPQRPANQKSHKKSCKSRKFMRALVQPARATQPTLKAKLARVMHALLEKLLMLRDSDLSVQQAIAFHLLEEDNINLDQDRTRFFMNVKTGKIKEVVSSLEGNRYLVFSRDFTGKTVLHWAVRRKNVAMAKTILRYLPFLNVKDFYDKTPLYYALENQQSEMVSVRFFLV
jgi:hypothetical protein